MEETVSNIPHQKVEQLAEQYGAEQYWLRGKVN